MNLNIGFLLTQIINVILILFIPAIIIIAAILINRRLNNIENRISKLEDEQNE